SIENCDMKSNISDDKSLRVIDNRFHVSIRLLDFFNVISRCSLSREVTGFWFDDLTNFCHITKQFLCPSYCILPLLYCLIEEFPAQARLDLGSDFSKWLD